MTKEEIRAEMRRRRKAVTPAERAAASAAICAQLLKGKAPHLLTFSPSHRFAVAVYIASIDEIDLTDFIGACSARGIRLAAPRWNGMGYELAELNDCWPGGLVEGPHKIPEPPSNAPLVDASQIGAWIVPGLAFTKDGARIGYGGGWYDRLMANARPDAKKIGVGYRFQVVDALPTDPHDIHLDEVVTN